MRSRSGGGNRGRLVIQLGSLAPTAADVPGGGSTGGGVAVPHPNTPSAASDITQTRRTGRSGREPAGRVVRNAVMATLLAGRVSCWVFPGPAFGGARRPGPGTQDATQQWAKTLLEA